MAERPRYPIIDRGQQASGRQFSSDSLVGARGAPRLWRSAFAIFVSRPAEVSHTATNRMEELAKIAHGFVDPLAQKSLYPENRARFCESRQPGSTKMPAGAKEVAALQANILDLNAKLATDAGAAAPQLSELQERQKRIVTERTLPVAAEAEEALEGG